MSRVVSDQSGGSVLELLEPGGEIDLSNCAREPIQLPGSIQPHGALLVVRRSDATVVQCSANIQDVLGVALDDALGAPLAEVLGAATAAQLTAGADDGSPQSSVATVAGEPFEVMVYPAEAGFRVIELEPTRADNTPDSGEAANPLDVRRLLEDLRSTSSVEDLLETATRIMRDETGHERVWAYRFAHDDHGEIIAEARSPRLESFLGHHFPESDIPAQARALYLRTGVRTIVDSQAEPAPIVPVKNPETGSWTDMSDGALRAVSPMHIAYLRAMGVRASMSVALVVDGQLWGLLSAHHYDEPRRLGRHSRAVAEMLGTLVGMRIDAFEQTDRASGLLSLQQHQSRVLECVGECGSVPGGLVADPDALLGICRASGAIVRISSIDLLVGQTPPAARSAELLDALDDRVREGEVISLENLSAEYPEFEDIADTASGVLIAPLSRRHGNVVVWLRPEQVREVTWGKSVRPVPPEANDVGRLTPWGSFALWKETVRLQSRPWLREEHSSALQLRSALGTLLLSQAEALARANSELLRTNAELDAFAYTAAHDLREPIRGINSLATFLIEDYGEALDDLSRERMDRLVEQAQRMAGLLDSLMKYATHGRAALAPQDLSVIAVANEAAEALSSRLANTGVSVLYGRDATLRADHAQLLEVLTNLIENALKYTSAERPMIEIGVKALSEAAREHGQLPDATNPFAQTPAPLVVYVADNGIGIAPEDRQEVFKLFRRLHARGEHGGGSGAGLTIVRRVVERHGGAVWIEDTPGGGCTFCFTLQR